MHFHVPMCLVNYVCRIISSLNNIKDFKPNYLTMHTGSNYYIRCLNIFFKNFRLELMSERFSNYLESLLTEKKENWPKDLKITKFYWGKMFCMKQSTTALWRNAYKTKLTKSWKYSENEEFHFIFKEWFKKVILNDRCSEF